MKKVLLTVLVVNMLLGGVVLTTASLAQNNLDPTDLPHEV